MVDNIAGFLKFQSPIPAATGHPREWLDPHRGAIGEDFGNSVHDLIGVILKPVISFAVETIMGKAPLDIRAPPAKRARIELLSSRWRQTEKPRFQTVRA
jgi:hypothetical protein